MDIEYISLTNENGNTTAINTLDKSFNTELGNVISEENRKNSWRPSQFLANLPQLAPNRGSEKR